MCQTEALQQKSGCCFKGQEGPNNDDGGDWRGEILSEIWVKKNAGNVSRWRYGDFYRWLDLINGF